MDDVTYPELAELISKVLEKTMKAGAATHSPGEWKQHGAFIHRDRAIAHINEGSVEDYEHAMVRIAMVLYQMGER